MAIVPIAPKERARPVARPRPAPDSPGPGPGYCVGYGKPPRHAQFKPGQSGNPKGRPKRAKGFNTLVREAMLERVKVRTARGEKTVTRAQAVVLKVIEKATKGDLRALERLLIWYQQALPETPDGEVAPQSALDFTETDAATLEAFKAIIAAEALAVLEKSAS